MQFQVRALRDGEGVTALTFEAPSAADALEQAKAQGLAVLSVRSHTVWPIHILGYGSTFQLTLFSQELLALLQAGLNLVDALETLAEKETRAEQRKVMRQILARLYEGHPLSFALQQFPAVFPALYIAAVRASEKTGDIDEALGRYVAYQTQVDAVRKRIVSASIYPVLLLAAGSMATLFLLLYVVPKFSRIYSDLGTQLPLFSKLLMAWGQLLEAHSLVAVVAWLVTMAGLAWAVAQPGVRRACMSQLWRLPSLGSRLKVYQLGRFYRTLGMLLRGGIPVVSAIDMVSGLLSPLLQTQLGMASQAIREGLPISAAMERHGLVTPVALRLLRVGEKSGEMGTMMERIAGFHDEEMSRWVDWFTRLFEPILMAFIGLAIGLIVVLMYLPIFELAGSIQ
ncbi:MAG TPA: type II secretion system F family protein [Parasulfuritortus sp.]